MDNIETTEPIGVEGATSSQENSAIDTQPVESSDSVSDGDVVEAGEAQNSWDSDPRFKGKSADDVFKSYRELEGKLGQREENLEVIKSLEQSTGLNAQQIIEAIEQQRTAQYQQQVQDNPGLAAFNELQMMKQQMALQAENEVLNQALNSEEGKPYQQFRDKIQEAAFNMPSMKNKPYLDIARELFGNAIAQGQQSAYKKIDSKVMTQATGASQSAPKGKFTDDDLDRMTAAELEAILPHADTSNRLY